MNHRILISAVGASLLLSGCSSRPREFNPSLGAPPADQAAFDKDYGECRELLVAGKLDRNGRLGSAGAGAAAGGVAAAGGMAAATSAGLYGGMAIASATIIAIPFVALGGAWGMAKIKRNKKEKAIQQAMAGCLDQRGHQIVGWSKAKKVKKAKPAAEPAA